MEIPDINVIITIRRPSWIYSAISGGIGALIVVLVFLVAVPCYADEDDFKVRPWKELERDMAIRSSRSYKEQINRDDTRDLPSVRRLIERACEDKRSRNITPLPEQCNGT